MIIIKPINKLHEYNYLIIFKERETFEYFKGFNDLAENILYDKNKDCFDVQCDNMDICYVSY